MHIPDGFLNAGVSIATGVVAVGAGAVALKKARDELDDKSVPVLALCAAFIFAAQMLNFPIAGGTSGHFLGAALAAVLLGPYLGSLVLMVVLIIQALLFADGGLTALGANIFNMAIVGVYGAYAIYYLLKRALPRGRAWFLSSTAISAWFSIVLAALACALELAISGTSPAGTVIPAMVGIHALIGIVEAAITVVVVGVVMAARPDLIRTYAPSDNLLLEEVA